MLQEKLNKLRRFGKDERSSFPYWFAHWKAFNMVALQLGHWKFKYLFHDIEKPWLMLLWKDYKRVQKWHRAHNTHTILTQSARISILRLCVSIGNVLDIRRLERSIMRSKRYGTRWMLGTRTDSYVLMFGKVSEQSFVSLDWQQRMRLEN